jgi:hypothetical protein
VQRAKLTIGACAAFILVSVASFSASAQDKPQDNLKLALGQRGN